MIYVNGEGQRTRSRGFEYYLGAILTDCTKGGKCFSGVCKNICSLYVVLYCLNRRTLVVCRRGQG